MNNVLAHPYGESTLCSPTQQNLKRVFGFLAVGWEEDGEAHEVPSEAKQNKCRARGMRTLCMLVTYLLLDTLTPSGDRVAYPIVRPLLAGACPLD